MPVLVTEAHRPLSRRIVARLLEEGGEVRAYTHGDASALRASGAMVASGSVDDEGRLEAALADVHTLVHVGCGVFDEDPAAEPWQAVVAAADQARVQRIVALSLPGAADDARDPLRRSKGVLERALTDLAVPTVVIRASLIDTLLMRDVLVTAGLADLADVEIAPVRVADLVELVAVFDAARSRATEGHLLVRADGPRRLRLGDYVEQLLEARGRTGRVLPAPSRVGALRSALDGPWTSDEPHLLDGWSFAQMDPLPPDGQA